MKYFLVYLFIEIAISISVFSSIGIFGTFIEIVVSAFIGIALLANSRYTLFESLHALKHQNISSATFGLLNIMSVLGAIFLILPGMFSDILGILMQFGILLPLIKNYVTKNNEQYQDKNNEDDIIDVEVIENNTTK